MSRPDYAPCRPPGRLVEEAGRPHVRPACTNVHKKEAVDHPIDRLKAWLSRLGAVDQHCRPWHGSVDRPVDRQARLDFPFRIQIPFLDGIKSNLGFLKSRDSVAIKVRLEPSCIVSQEVSSRILSSSPLVLVVLIVESIKSLSPLPRGRRHLDEPR